MTEELFFKGFGMFLIATVRFSAFFISMPAFGEGVTPMSVKGGLSALFSLLILPHLLRTQSLPDFGVLGYGFMAVKEMVIGLTIGFVVSIAVDTLRFSGEILGMQIGFSFVQVIDPESSRSQAVVGEFFQLVGTLMFLIVGGHVILLQVFAESFDLVPLAGTAMNGSIVSEIVKMTCNIFWLGFQVSMPVIAIILMGDVALGLIARTVPRLNVFQVGFPVKILLGLWTVGLMLPFLTGIIKNLYLQVYGQINTLLNAMH